MNQTIDRCVSDLLNHHSTLISTASDEKDYADLVTSFLVAKELIVNSFRSIVEEDLNKPDADNLIYLLEERAAFMSRQIIKRNSQSENINNLN